MTISIGKLRGLSQCATEFGTFAILALDHRNNLRTAMNPENPGSVPYNSLVEFKQQVVDAVAPQSSAVLVDPHIGAAPVVDRQDLPGNVGLLVAVEETGYSGDSTDRINKIQPVWSVGKTKRMGASGAKLLIYYHPDAPHAHDQENLISQVVESCGKFDLPLFLEPLSFSIDPEKKKLSSAEKRQVVVETARRLSPLGIDILKAEFPLEVEEEPDEAVWRDACTELTEASKVPWVLLSAGVDFDTFLRQVEAACRAGASGVLAGRAIWKEAVDLNGQDRLDFLGSTASMRMEKMYQLCNALAHPWTKAFPMGPITEDWYRTYPDLD